MPHCYIPGCSNSNKDGTKFSFFKVLRPDLAKNREEKNHRENLTKFILSVRDYTRGDKIREMLHKESAQICEDHFIESDIIQLGKRKVLKIGALPTKNLPKKVFNGEKSKEQRKAPLIRQPLPVPIRHPSLSHLQKACTRISKTLSDTWSFTMRGGCFVVNCFKSENNLVPDISVWISQDMSIKTVAYSGWKVDIGNLGNINIMTSTLSEFLGELDKYRICVGGDFETRNTKKHWVQKWDCDHIVGHCFNRSPCCKIIVTGVDRQCEECVKYDTRTKFNRLYCSKEKILKADENEMIAVDENFHTDIHRILSSESGKMNEWLQMFIEDQYQNANKCPNRRRYHPDVIRWAIELYSKSAAAYQQLRTSSVLTLPSSATLRQYRNFACSEPGMNPFALNELQRNDSPIEAYITVDEMKVKENLVVSNGKLVGFVDYAERHSSDDIATHICMFYLRSFKKEISLPLSWWPTTTTPAFQLASMFWEAVVNDSQKHEHLSASEYVAPNPYRNNWPIFLCSDTSHLLKTARNSLYSSKPGGTKYLSKSGHDILWTHVRSLYKLDCSQPLHKTRLTQTHIELNSYNKMRVSLARETMSWAVGKAMSHDITGSEGTVEYLLMIDKWFEIITCRVKNPIKNPDDERLQWLRHTFVQYFLDWENEVSLLYPNERKRIIATPTLRGLVFTTINMIALAKRLLADGMEYVCLGTLTQDVLEAFFGNLRSRSCRNSNPDISQVSYGVASLSQRKIIKKIKGGNTTFGKKNPWTTVCEVPMPKRKKH